MRPGADIVAKAADILGRKEEAGEYRALADRQWQEVRREYFTSTGRCAVKTQTGLLLALKYHISSDEEKTRQMLKKLLRDSGNKLNTGFVGTPLLCNVLTDNGMTDAAYRLLLNEEYPGWLREVKLGATTIWERWNSLGEDGKVSSTGMNSFNHYAYGAILEWMFRHVGGIDVRENAPGAKTVRIAPKVHADVKSAEQFMIPPAERTGAAGRFWTITGFGFRWKCPSARRRRCSCLCRYQCVSG